MEFLTALGAVTVLSRSGFEDRITQFLQEQETSRMVLSLLPSGAVVRVILTQRSVKLLAIHAESTAVLFPRWEKRSLPLHGVGARLVRGPRHSRGHYRLDRRRLAVAYYCIWERPADAEGRVLTRPVLLDSLTFHQPPGELDEICYWQLPIDRGQYEVLRGPTPPSGPSVKTYRHYPF